MEQSKSFRAGPLNIRVTLPAPGWRTGAAGPQRERLSVERIVDTALDLMRSKGYDAVSMRAIAKALETGPASLYAHVANKEHLDQLVVDRIAQQVPIPEPDPDRWDEQIKQMMRDTLAAYRQYPGAARATMAIIPTELGALRSAEGMLALCKAGGLTDQVAAWACDLLSLYVGAVAVEESIWAERTRAAGRAGAEVDEQLVVDQVRAYFESLPADRFPLVSAMAVAMTTGDGEDRFEFALSVLLSGMRAVSEQG
ncbi:MAG TPA: TetR/AcrR family transcriptional regulator [Nocardioidaceae bacterium]|nr:TetR/AcrR family transcriptional regulator [Nocardioidaceae bacterium]